MMHPNPRRARGPALAAFLAVAGLAVAMLAFHYLRLHLAETPIVDLRL